MAYRKTIEGVPDAHGVTAYAVTQEMLQAGRKFIRCADAGSRRGVTRQAVEYAIRRKILTLFTQNGIKLLDQAQVDAWTISPVEKRCGLTKTKAEAAGV